MYCILIPQECKIFADITFSPYLQLDSYRENIICEIIIATLHTYARQATWPVSMKISFGNYFTNSISVYFQCEISSTQGLNINKIYVIVEVIVDSFV